MNVYKHFKGAYYGFLGDAIYLQDQYYAVKMKDVICFHEPSDGEVLASLYVGQEHRLFVSPINGDPDELKDEIWSVYQSLITGKIWFRPASEMFDQMPEMGGAYRFTPVA